LLVRLLALFRRLLVRLLALSRSFLIILFGVSERLLGVLRRFVDCRSKFLGLLMRMLIAVMRFIGCRLRLLGVLRRLLDVLWRLLSAAVRFIDCRLRLLGVFFRLFGLLTKLFGCSPRFLVRLLSCRGSKVACVNESLLDFLKSFGLALWGSEEVEFAGFLAFSEGTTINRKVNRSLSIPLPACLYLSIWLLSVLLK
jgi:hypothetical protein